MTWRVSPNPSETCPSELCSTGTQLILWLRRFSLSLPRPPRGTGRVPQCVL